MTNDADDNVTVRRRAPAGDWHIDEKCLLFAPGYSGTSEIEERTLPLDEALCLEPACVCLVGFVANPHSPLTDEVRERHLRAESRALLAERVARLGEEATYEHLGAVRLHLALAVAAGVVHAGAYRDELDAAACAAEQREPLAHAKWKVVVRLLARSGSWLPARVRVLQEMVAVALAQLHSRSADFEIIHKMIGTWSDAVLRGGYDAGERALVESYWTTLSDLFEGAARLCLAAKVLARAAEDALARALQVEYPDDLLVVELAHRPSDMLGAPALLRAAGRGGVTVIAAGRYAAFRVPSLLSNEVAYEIGIDAPSSMRNIPRRAPARWYVQLPAEADLAAVAELSW